MNLRPLHDRVLIKPERNPEQTESELWLSEHKKPEQTGTVVAVGACEHPQRKQEPPRCSHCQQMERAITQMARENRSLEKRINEMSARAPHLSPEDAKHSCPRCEMDRLDCVCPEPEARVPHPERTEPVKLRSASESVGWLNSVGPLSVSPTFKHPDEPTEARAPQEPPAALLAEIIVELVGVSSNRSLGQTMRAALEGWAERLRKIQQEARVEDSMVSAEYPNKAALRPDEGRVRKASIESSAGVARAPQEPPTQLIASLKAAARAYESNAAYGAITTSVSEQASLGVLLNQAANALERRSEAQEAPSAPPLDLMRQFCGWLSGDIRELHGVEVPRLADSLTRFMAALPSPPAAHAAKE